MVRNVDYDSRRRAVLTAAIKRYINSAIPVSSEELAENFDLSPATIRKIFSELEEGGYLTHRYTSGGRIPTNKGYRYYVDFLISQIELLDNEKKRIVNEYQRQINRLDDVLEKTSEIISQITHYAGIVCFLEWHDRLLYTGVSRILEQPEFQNMEKMRVIVRMIEEKERLISVINRDFEEDVKVYIGDEIEFPELENCSLIVSTFHLKNKPSGRLAVLGPNRMEYEYTISRLGYISRILTEALSRI